MEEAEITVFEKGPYVSFANCGLPYHVSGEIENREQLLVQTADNLKKRFAIDVRPNHEVLAIDRKAKTVTVKNQEQVFTQDYDVLVLSPGAKPVVPNFPGLAEAQNVFTVRSVPDIDRIMAHLQQQAIQHVTVVGAGFIGLEMVENLAKRQLQVTLIEKAPQVLPALDPEMATFVEEELVKNGVNVLTNQGVSGFREKGREVVLEDGQVLTSDLTILAIGVQPESRLAKETGLTLGLREAIVVDENYRTSDPDIYAIGDAILVTQHTSKEQTLISLASPANRQGRQVADIIAGLPRKNKGSLGTAIVRTFAMTAAFTGLNERTLKRLGKNYQVVHTLGKHHASYYPDATDILLKKLDFTIPKTPYTHDNKVPMSGEATLDIYPSQFHYAVRIDATRSVGKLELYFTKNISSSELYINKVSLGQEPNKGYLFETPENDTISYTATRDLFVSDTGQPTEINTVLTGESLPGNIEDYQKFFKKITILQPYLLENLYGGDNIQVEGVDTSVENFVKRYYIDIEYTIDSAIITKRLYLTKIDRNTLNKVFIRIKEKVFDIELTYKVKPWEMVVLTPEL